MANAEDLGNYYRIPADVRDLNYSCYFVEGQENISLREDYTSHNTERLDVEGMTGRLLQLELIQRALRGEEIVL
jgi:UDP-glucose 4-epimerase